MKTPERQADEIVEMFRKIIPFKEDYMQLAILHVTGIIEVLEKVRVWNCKPLTLINHYQQILTILKEKL